MGSQLRYNTLNIAAGTGAAAAHLKVSAEVVQLPGQAAL